MTTYLALLRGINVGGHKIIKMDLLKSIFESMGLQRVRTYIQSGNVAFLSEETDQVPLAKHIEANLATALGYEVPTLLRTRQEIQEAIDQLPFGQEAFAAGAKLYVSLLPQRPETARVAKLESYSNNSERFVVVGRNVYTLLPPNGADKLRYSNNFLEKELALPATTRNWATMNKLLEI